MSIFFIAWSFALTADVYQGVITAFCHSAKCILQIGLKQQYNLFLTSASNVVYVICERVNLTFQPPFFGSLMGQSNL